jgi:hypothetical protein
MRRHLACSVLLFALAGCGSKTDQQLEAVKAARTVLAEWALVEQQSAKGETPATYADQMREEARIQLRTAQSSLLADQPEAANLIGALADGEPSAAALQAADDRLEPLEKRLELT